VITFERANYLFAYDPATGILRRRVPAFHGPAKAGMAVGTRTSKAKAGLRVGIGGRYYHVHHICWLLYYGIWPQNQIDHKNMDAQDNRIENLREATASENGYNRIVRPESGTGVKGVHLDKRTGRYRAEITVNKKRIYLGFFATVEEAKIARSSSQWMHGEFARGV
jgi:HNH endonuclease